MQCNLFFGEASLEETWIWFVCQILHNFISWILSDTLVQSLYEVRYMLCNANELPHWVGVSARTTRRIFKFDWPLLSCRLLNINLYAVPLFDGMWLSFDLLWCPSLPRSIKSLYLLDFYINIIIFTKVHASHENKNLKQLITTTI